MRRSSSAAAFRVLLQSPQTRSTAHRHGRQGGAPVTLSYEQQEPFREAPLYPGNITHRSLRQSVHLEKQPECDGISALEWGGQLHRLTQAQNWTYLSRASTTARPRRRSAKDVFAVCNKSGKGALENDSRRRGARGHARPPWIRATAVELEYLDGLGGLCWLQRRQTRKIAEGPRDGRRGGAHRLNTAATARQFAASASA